MLICNTVADYLILTGSVVVKMFYLNYFLNWYSSLFFVLSFLSSSSDPGGLGSERRAAGADVHPGKLQHGACPGGAAAQVQLNVCGET